MAALPDWQITDLCTPGGWPTHWRPGSNRFHGSVEAFTPEGIAAERHSEAQIAQLGLAGPPPWQDIPNAGPMVDPFDPSLLDASTLDTRLGLVFESPQTLNAWATRSDARVGRVQPEVTAAGAFRIDGAAALRAMRADCIEVELAPKQVLACISAEYFRIPPNIQSKLYTRSTMARAWIDHSTATKIHPGFQGEIAFEIVNHGVASYTIRSGMRLIQIEFEYMAAVPGVPYFAKASAKYHDQRGRVHGADNDGKQ